MQYSLIYAISHSFVLLLCRMFFGLKVYGLDQVPREGAVIIAVNHTSYFDPVFVGAAISNRQIGYLARESLFRNRFFAWLILKYHSIPIKRGSADRVAFSKATEILKKGGAILMFPEGTRSTSGELLPAKRGVGYLAIKSGAPIIPTYVSGSFEVLSKMNKIPKIHKVKVYFGKKIELDPYLNKVEEKKLYQEISDEIMRQIGLLEKTAKTK